MQRTKWHCLCRNAVCTVLQKVTSRLRWHQCNCTIKWRPNRWRPCSRSPTLVGSVTRQTRKRVSAKCFFQLRQLRRIRRSLDDDSVATLVHAFVASRVDYCGSLLIGAPRKATDKLQRVLDSAARIVSNTRKFNRGLTHFRRSQLHWLDVDRVRFRVCVQVFRCLYKTAPEYLSTYCQTVSGISGYHG